MEKSKELILFTPGELDKLKLGAKNVFNNLIKEIIDNAKPLRGYEKDIQNLYDLTISSWLQNQSDEFNLWNHFITDIVKELDPKGFQKALDIPRKFKDNYYDSKLNEMIKLIEVFWFQIRFFYLTLDDTHEALDALNKIRLELQNNNLQSRQKINESAKPIKKVFNSDIKKSKQKFIKFYTEKLTAGLNKTQIAKALELKTAKDLDYYLKKYEIHFEKRPYKKSK